MGMTTKADCAPDTVASIGFELLVFRKTVLCLMPPG